MSDVAAPTKDRSGTPGHAHGFGPEHEQEHGQEQEHHQGAADELPGAIGVSPIRRSLRYLLVAAIVRLLVRSWVRLRVVGLERLPPGPSIICLNHQNWLDPFFVSAGLPLRPRLYFFGPKEEDMSVGGRNRLMTWVGTSVPFRPGKRDLLDAVRHVERIAAAGGRLAIFGEGRIHVGESELLPLSDGPAFFALRCRVPLVPVALNGNGWIGFGRTVRLVIGEPIVAEGRPDRPTVTALTARLDAALRETIGGFPDRPAPGRFGRWLTERFNVWDEGQRPPVPGSRGEPGAR